MITAGDIRVGMILKIDGQYFRVLKTQFVKPGKGGAFSSCTFKNVLTNQQKEVTLRTEEKIEKVNIYDEIATCISINKNNSTFILDNANMMDIENDIITNFPFLQENMKVIIQFADDQTLLNVKLPDSFECLVVSAQSFIKGQTATAHTKPAVLENGVQIKVPSYVNSGQLITIKIIDDIPTFMSRVTNG